MTELSTTMQPPPTFRRWIVGLSLAAIAWVAAYAYLTQFADAMVATTGLPRGTHFAEAVHFFFYDTPKEQRVYRCRAMVTVPAISP